MRWPFESYTNGRNNMARCILLAAGFAAVSIGNAAAAAEYANPELLVSPAGLAELIASGEPLTVVHAGGASAIPGAAFVDVAEWKAAFGDSPGPADEWGERIGRLGVGPGTRVVVYDEGSVKNAARVWWILRYWGVDTAALLDGGMHAWAEGGRETVEAGLLPPRAAADFKAVAEPDRLLTTEQVVALTKRGGALFIDTRSDPEVESLGKITDGAQHCEWVRLIDPRTRRFKPAKELAELLQLDESGEPLPYVTYCRSGGRASVTAFALELMGAPQVANYHGSWNAWSGRDGATE